MAGRDEVVADLFLSAWCKATPRQRRQSPVEIVEGCYWEPYTRWMAPPDVPVPGAYPYLRLWVVPVALRRKDTGQDVMRFLHIQTWPDSDPKPVPRWADPAALDWLTALADALSEATLAGGEAWGGGAGADNDPGGD